MLPFIGNKTAKSAAVIFVVSSIFFRSSYLKITLPIRNMTLKDTHIPSPTTPLPPRIPAPAPFYLDCEYSMWALLRAIAELLLHQ